MTEKNHHITYTAKDIERYHSGKMLLDEMHQLEKAALDDPFLADALEGYLYTQSPTNDLQGLHNELQTRTGKEKIVSLNREKRTSQLWKIAALFIFIAGIGWFVYQFSFSSKNYDLATSQQATKENSEPAKADTITAQPNNINSDAAEQKNEMAAAEPKNLSKKKNTVANKEPTPQKNTFPQAMKENSIPTLEDDQAETKLYLNPDTNAVDVAASSTQPAKKRTLSAGKENIIVLERDTNSMVQEVVIGKGKKDSITRRPVITFEEAEPANGNAFYDDYVAQNLKQPEIEKMKRTSGVVKLSFDVNDAGEPVNIKVENSLCQPCDKEAIRILKEGPKWVKKNKKGKVSIRF